MLGMSFCWFCVLNVAADHLTDSQTEYFTLCPNENERLKVTAVAIVKNLIIRLTVRRQREKQKCVKSTNTKNSNHLRAAK